MPFFGPFLFLLHLAWDGETRMQAHGPGEDISFGVWDLKGVLLYSAFLHLSDHLTMHLDWFEDSGWWIQNIAAGWWDCCSDVRVTCQFKTVKRSSVFILRRQTLLVRENLPMPDWTSLAYPIGGVTSPCLSLDSSGPCAWQLLPLEAGLSHVLTSLILCVCMFIVRVFHAECAFSGLLHKNTPWQSAVLLPGWFTGWYPLFP